MANKYNLISLTDGAKMIGIPPASLNRIQRETRIWQLGTRGSPVNLTPKDIVILKRIKIFRVWDVPFKTITGIHKLEEEILKEIHRLTKKYAIQNEWWQKPWTVTHEMLVHEESFKMIEDGVLFNEDEDLILGYFTDDDVRLDCVKYIELYKEFKDAKEWLIMKREEYFKNTEQVMAASKEIRL